MKAVRQTSARNRFDVDLALGTHIRCLKHSSVFLQRGIQEGGLLLSLVGVIVNGFLSLNSVCDLCGRFQALSSLCSREEPFPQLLDVGQESWPSFLSHH